MRIRVYADGTLQEWALSSTDAAFWGRYFSEVDVECELAIARSGKIVGDLEGILRRHLPRRRRIPEAGCGLGRVVLALRVMGYDCVGVDFSETCIARARAEAPGLPVEPGDVRTLDLPDGALPGYISLGVVEHERAGSQAFLAEARRVLAPGGALVLSLPFANGLRRAKTALGCYPKAPPTGDWQFYQYLYSREQVRRHVVTADFHVVRSYDVDAARGLSKEFRFMHRLENWSPFLWWQLARPFHYVGLLKSLVAHMHVVVAVKT